MLGVVNILLHEEYTWHYMPVGWKMLGHFHLYRLLFLAVFKMACCQAQHASYQTYIIILNYECIFWKPALFFNRDRTKISAYLNFSQNSFILGSPYNFTSYATVNVFKLNIINLSLIKLIIHTPWCSTHTMFLFCCISITYQGWFASLISWPLEYQNCCDSICLQAFSKCSCGFVDCFCLFLSSVTSLHSSSVSCLHVGGLSSASTFSLNVSALFNLEVISAQFAARITLSCHIAHFCQGSIAIITWFDI
jgi:hypothetical protein